MSEVKGAEKKRDVSLDVIRCAAVISVSGVHFFHCGFYQEVVTGKTMLAMSFIRTFCMVCVPLFMLLSGYLMNQKTPTKRYYAGIWKTLSIYLLVSIACILHKNLYLNMGISLQGAIAQILKFEAADYSWYIEMYFGLYLLIPFLNILWNNIGEKRIKQLLIVVLIICTALPSLMNSYDLHTSGFWQMPSISTDYNQLIPKWWVQLYPLTYYFIGAYIKEFEVRISIKKNIAALLGAVFVFGVYNYYRSYNGYYNLSAFTEWDSYQNLIDGVLLFLLLKNINYSKVPSVCIKMIRKVSELSLAIYLCSSIFDSTYHGILMKYIENGKERLPYFLIVVPAVFLSSLILAQVIFWIKGAIAMVFRYAAGMLKQVHGK